MQAENNKGTLHLNRSLSRCLDPRDKVLRWLRNFFQTVRTVDEQQVILQPQQPAPAISRRPNQI